MVEDAVGVFGSRVRVAVLRSLSVDGRATRAELVRRLDVSEANLHDHLAALEAAGVIHADPARDRETGPVTRRFDVDTARIRLLWQTLGDAVLPPAGSHTGS